MEPNRGHSSGYVHEAPGNKSPPPAERRPSRWRGAFFVKNHDAIPGPFADGFDDDHREFTGIRERLAGTLDHFELWQSRQGAKSSRSSDIRARTSALEPVVESGL